MWAFPDDDKPLLSCRFFDGILLDASIDAAGTAINAS